MESEATDDVVEVVLAPAANRAAMEPGFYDGLPEEEYHSGPEVSISRLKVFAGPGGPAKVKAGRTAEQTPAQMFGTLVHTGLLEPHKMAEKFHVVDLARISDREKATQAERAIAGGRELVKRADWNSANEVWRTLLANPDYQELMADETPLPEFSFFWRDARTDLMCRGRADIWLPRKRIILDFKKCSNGAGADAFAKVAANYKYHWQDAWYRWGIDTTSEGEIDVQDMIFCAIDPGPPVLVGFHTFSRHDQEAAANDIMDAMEAWKQCEVADDWPGLPAGINQLKTLPPWAHVTQPERRY